MMKNDEECNFNLLISIANHDICLGKKILSYLDFKEVSTLFNVDKSLKKCFEGETIVEIIEIISNCQEFYQKRQDWTNYLLSFNMKSKTSFEAIKSYFLDASSYLHENGLDRTPLHRALLENNTMKFKAFLDLLPKKIINKQEPLDRNDSILHFAVAQHLPSMVKVLLNDPRVDVTLEDEDDETALVSVLHRHDVEMYCIFWEANQTRGDIDFNASVTNNYENGYRDYDEDGYFCPNY